MANIQNKKTAPIFQDELDIMLDGLNMENYADTLNNDGNDSERFVSETSFVKAVPSQGKSIDLDKLLMGADMERPGPKLVKVNIKSEKNPNIDVLLDSVSAAGDAETKQKPGKENVGFEFGVSEADDNSEELISAVRSIAANKAFAPVQNDKLDKSDDFEAFDEYGEIRGFEHDKHSLNAAELKITQSVKAESLVDLEESFGVEFNTAQDEFESFEVADEVAELSAPVEDTVSAHTLSEVQNKLDEYLKLAAERAIDHEAKQTSDKPVNFVAAEAVPATQNKVVADYEILGDELPDFSDNSDDSLVESVAFVAEESEIAQVKDENSIEDRNAVAKDITAAQHSFADILERIELPDTEHKLSVPEPLAEAALLHEEISANGALEFGGAETPVSAIAEMPVLAVSTSEVDADIMAQLNELWVAHNLIKQQVVDFTTLKNNVDQLDQLVKLEAQERKERKDFKKLLDSSENSSKKVPGLVYVAAGISTLSFLIGGGLFAYGVSVNSDVKELKAHIAALEGDLTLINQGNIPAIAKQGSDDLNAPAQVKAPGAQIPAVDSATEDFTQAMEKQAKPLSNNSAASKVSQATQTKPDQAIRVITADNKDKASSKTASQNTALWVANLMSFKQDWYANRKLAEFAKQGIKAVVMPVDVKGETWYILRSSGFSTQEQALEFAAKAKQSLNLASVLVTQNE